MPSMTLSVEPNSPFHNRLTSRLRSRINYAEKIQNEQHERWRKAEETALAYVPESDVDRMRRDKRDSIGTMSYTTIQLPYSYALLMAAHTYITSVFFGRDPVHQFSGRHGETEMQVLAIEAMMSYQVLVGEMMGPYYIQIYDSLKYGIGITGEYWDEEVIQYGEIVELPDENGVGVKSYVSQQKPGYKGNRVYNISPFDFLPDPRVPVGRFQEGEFVCVLKKVPWSQVLRRKYQGYYTNIELIRKGEQFQGDMSNGSAQLKRPEDFAEMVEDWGIGPEGMSEPKHPTTVQLYEVYIDLIPSEWGLGKSNYNEKWVFTLTNAKDLIIGAQPLGLIHGKYPFTALESEVEGYGAWNRGIPEVMSGIQNTLDWLLNTHFYNVRASLNNQFIIDPSKIVLRDVEQGGPGFVYRMRPEAYGEDVRKFFMQVPVGDVTKNHPGEIQNMFQMGERVLGINDQMMGMVNQGGRKTATEIRTSSSFGVNRLKTIAEYMSATGFSQHSQRLLQSTQQYYDIEQKLRIVGDTAKNAGQKFLMVDANAIAGAFDFIPVDGTLPVDRFAQANLWKEILMGLRNVPQVMMQYDVGKIFAWMAQLGGIKNIEQFKIQVMPDAVLADQAARGNSVPATGGIPGNPSSGNIRAMPGGAVTPGASASNDAGMNAV